MSNEAEFIEIYRGHRVEKCYLGTHVYVHNDEPLARTYRHFNTLKDCEAWLDTQPEFTKADESVTTAASTSPNTTTEVQENANEGAHR